MVDDQGGGSPLYLPQGYKDRTHSTTEGIASTGQVGEKGTVTQTEHWDGSTDATVRPGSVGVKLNTQIKMTIPEGADPNPQHVAAIARYEKAVRRLQFARKTKDDSFLARAESEAYDAKRELEATQ